MQRSCSHSRRSRRGASIRLLGRYRLDATGCERLAEQSPGDAPSQQQPAQGDLFRVLELAGVEAREELDRHRHDEQRREPEHLDLAVHLHEGRRAGCQKQVIGEAQDDGKRRARIPPPLPAPTAQAGAQAPTRSQWPPSSH
jgi:hypothetical protein